MSDEILGVKINNLDRAEILEKIEDFLNEPRFHQIATVNPEFILEAQKNQDFRDVLNDSDINIADGFGISCAFLRNFKNLKCRMAGADLLMKILEIAENRGLGVFLACRKDGLTSFDDKGSRLVGDGQSRFDRAWRWQRLDFYDVLIVDWAIHTLSFPMEGDEWRSGDKKPPNVANCGEKVHSR